MIEEGFVKKIREDNKLDIGIGKQGVEKLDDDQVKLIQLLKLHKGFLPYHDKSSPEDIYAFFGISKKAFKMNVGMLYKAKKITIEDAGIRLIPETQASQETLTPPEA
jgi:predicted RNA-binding protein (virulence factor B family)